MERDSSHDGKGRAGSMNSLAMAVADGSDLPAVALRSVARHRPAVLNRHRHCGFMQPLRLQDLLLEFSYFFFQNRRDVQASLSKEFP